MRKHSHFDKHFRFFVVELKSVLPFLGSMAFESLIVKSVTDATTCAPDAPHAAARLASMAHIGHQKAGFAFKIISFHPNNIFLRMLGCSALSFVLRRYERLAPPRPRAPPNGPAPR